MAVFYVWETCGRAEDERHAGSKAPADIDTIFMDGIAQPLHVPYDNGWQSDESSLVSKLKGHKTGADNLTHAVRALSPGDILVMNFPLRAHSIFISKVFRACKKRGVRTVLYVHDIDTIRSHTGNKWTTRTRVYLEEGSALKYADVIVLHNPAMVRVMEQTRPETVGRNVSLGLFDYLSDQPLDDGDERFTKDGPVIVAGNLNRSKAAYLYDLPSNQRFSLYGVHWEGSDAPHVAYQGSFPSDELPGILRGSFGLVWDGDSTTSCAGRFGEYLRVNNPHKASLYLSSGLPVIIWDQSALAGFVAEHNVGLAVSDLADIAPLLSNLSDDDYAVMRHNAKELAIKLRKGWFTKAAFSRALALLGADADGSFVEEGK